MVGVEKFNLNLLNELAESPHAISIYCDSSWKEELSKKPNFKKLEIFKVPKFFKIPWPNMLLALLHALTKGLTGRRYDILLLGNVGKVVIPFSYVLCKAGLAKKIILIAHREPSKAFLKFLKKFDSTVVSVNKIITQQFLDAGIKKSYTDYGVSNATPFLSIERKPRTQTEPLRFCVYGNLAPSWKGADTAVEAFKLLPPEVRKNSELHLAGYSGKPPQHEVEGVKAYKWLSASQTIEFLEDMDIAVFPSRDTGVMKETFSQSSVQAMLSGLPIIVSSLPILVEKLEHGGGLVFTESPDDLARKMEELYNNRARILKLGQEARESAKANFIWSTRRFLERYFQVSQ